MKRKKREKRYTKSRANKKYTRLWWILSIAFTLILLVLLFDPKTFRGGDNTHYFCLGQSLLKGSYRSEVFMGAPLETGVTPGYPIVLAFLSLFFGRTFIPAKFFSLFCFVGTLIIWWRIFNNRGVNKKMGFVFLGFIVINPLISEFSHWELTEAPFMFVSSITFLSLLYAWDSEKTKMWIITGLCAALAFYIRVAGITLVMSILFILLLHKKWKSFIIVLITVAILLLPWLIFLLTASGQTVGGRYLPQFYSETGTGEVLSVGDFIGRLLRNSQRYAFINLPMMFLPILETSFYTNLDIGYLLGGIFIALILIGIICTIMTIDITFSIYFIFYLLLLISFSEEAAIVRYLVVIAPILIFLFVKGTERVFLFLRLTQDKTYLIITAVLLFILTLPVYIREAGKNAPLLNQYIKGNKYAGYPSNFVRFIEANEWIKNHDKTSTGIISRKPKLTWWYSGHPARNYLFNPDPHRVKADIDTSGAHYVLIDRISSTTPQFLIPALQTAPQQFKVLFVTRRPETYVLEVMR